MKERTLRILQALVEDFIETANPVASGRLLQSGNFKVSSATVRNEFALLEEVGLIESPHVSAGKIPTAKGYRFFVDELVEESSVDNLVRNIFSNHIADYKTAKAKETILDALRLVSQLSGNVAFVHVNEDRTSYIGLSNVLRSPEFLAEPEKAAQIVEILEGRERFRALLSNLELRPDEVKIFIGEENLLEEISSCAMLVTPFKTVNTSGMMGILGPMRMKYGFNKALLQEAKQLIL